MICVNNVFNNIMNHALDEELIPSNHVKGVLRQLTPRSREKAKINPLNSQEVSLFLRTCLKTSPNLYPLFLTAFRTGMRLGELLALEWADIDWNGRYLWVKHSRGDYGVGPTKNGKEHRIDMSDQLYETLHNVFISRKAEALKKGRGTQIDTLLFLNDGQHISKIKIRLRFKEILSRAGIRDMRFHDIRHTFASQLLTNGCSPTFVMEQMGHSSIQITVDTYGHLIPSGNRDAVNSLDNTDMESGTAFESNLHASSYQ